MKFAIAALGASLIAVSAHAGGYTAPVVETAPAAVEPVIVESASDWTGFYAGAQWGKGNADLDFDGDEVSSDDFDAYGIHGGYMHDMGKFVVGGELDYNQIDINDQDEKGDLTRLRARAGYDMGRFLPYVTAGAAHLSQDLNSGVDFSETAFTYGIGADFKVTEKVTVGAEYTRQDFNDLDNIDGLDLDTDMVQVRAAYRF
ncbi:porin family protein [Paracoccus sp. 1_MG-2023]|uniref:outer membrane protein n=1 Tax=unclassified Paracoccus (in: a-proteobacteria) TaxID=2688777 RepID=UPI001C08058A|nr:MULTISPECIES: porin family protein [unclassified Paracoccus (in: a-proteobacteria)]MBU2956310.1 porin family protein [Paracoccus sp. C2R09]MDO6667986.1 porin family protein [Paracoccus sp. 1_MG-2023]